MTVVQLFLQFVLQHVHHDFGQNGFTFWLQPPHMYLGFDIVRDYVSIAFQVQR